MKKIRIQLGYMIKTIKKWYRLEVGMTQLYGIDYAVYKNEISKIVSLIAQ